MSDPSLSYPSDQARWIGLVLLLLGLAGALGFDLYAEYRSAYASEREQVDKAARTVEVNLSRNLQTTSDALESIRDELPWLLSQQIEHNDNNLLNRRLQAMAVAQTGVRSLLVVNAAGRSIASSRPELIGRDFRDGERYQTISRGLDPARLYVSAPFLSPLNVYVMSVGRVLLDGHGKFDGYVLAILDPAYFSVLLDSVRYAPDMRIALIHQAGKVVFRVPDPEGVTGLDLLAKPDSLYWQHARSGQDRSLVEGRTPTTDQELLVAFRAIRPTSSPADKSLVVSVSRDQAVILAPWRKNLLVRIVLFCAIACLAAIGLLICQRRRAAYARLQAIRQADQEQAESQLRDSEQRFRDLFVHLPVAYQSLDVAGCWLDANQKMADLLGFESPQQLLGLDFIDFWGDQYRSQFDAAYDQFKANHNVDGEITLRRRDGRPVDVLFTGRIQRDAQGRFLRTHCVLLDISERLAMEQHVLQLNAELESKVEARTAALAQANEELHHQARHDALTGLANRMAANERLRSEFLLMKRSLLPYAVLLLDIDHFKRVNDSLGHDAGDKVLQGVAHLLRASLRESDLLARWGGEEFLVLLPATDMTEACLVAEKLRQGIELAPDLVAGGITLSIGVATAGPEQLSEDDAVRLADLQLYGAKKAGRNRVHAGAAA
ncbi:MAG: diguanylate cyclase [Burkholderiales bacterium]|nr:diguanylate cyclase [Burkholderiales bacterium]